MNAEQARRARLTDPSLYAETVTALLKAGTGTGLPYCIQGLERDAAGAVAAVNDLELAGLVYRHRVLCDGEVLEVAVRTQKPINRQKGIAA
jgi:hypothetical protein